MAITVKCPSCSVTLKLAEELLGSTVKCSSCKATLRLPAPPKVVTARALPKREAVVEFVVVEDEPEAPIRFKEEEDEPIRPKKRSKRRKKKKTSIIATILVSIWFFVIVPGGIIARHLSIREKLNRISERDKARESARSEPRATVLDSDKSTVSAAPRTNVWTDVKLDNIGCEITFPVPSDKSLVLPTTDGTRAFQLTGYDDQGNYYVFKYDYGGPYPQPRTAVSDYLATFIYPIPNRESNSMTVQGHATVETRSQYRNDKYHLNRIIAEYDPRLGLIVFTMSVISDTATLNSPNIRQYFDSIKFDRAMP